MAGLFELSADIGPLALLALRRMEREFEEEGWQSWESKKTRKNGIGQFIQNENSAGN